MECVKNVRLCPEYEVSEPTIEDENIKSTLVVPTQTEVRSQLGPKLANVAFENISQECRIMMGLEPFMLGPGQTWISPESRLRNDPCEEPVPEPRQIRLQAFCHEAILDIGGLQVERMEEKCRLEKEEALRLAKIEWEVCCQKRIREAIENTRAEDREYCYKIIGTLMEHFDACFEKLVEETEERMNKECEERVQNERAIIASYMLEQLEKEVLQKEMELCLDFQETLEGELRALNDRLQKQMRMERRAYEEAMLATKAKYERMLRELKVDLQTSCLVDICSAIIQERMRAKRDVQDLEIAFCQELEKLKQLISCLESRRGRIAELTAEHTQKIKTWREQVQGLIQQFQKFINFALEAVPGQAEFLLSIEKLLLDKFTDDDAFLAPDDYEKLKSALMKKSTKEITGLIESRNCEEDGENENVVCVKQPPTLEQENKSNFNFNYCRFKYSLKKDSKTTKKNSKSNEKQIEPVICASFGKIETQSLKPKETNQIQPEICTSSGMIGEHTSRSRPFSSQIYQKLMLVGENDKDHLVPKKLFAEKRLQDIYEVIKRHPDMALEWLAEGRKHH